MFIELHCLGKETGRCNNDQLNGKMKPEFGHHPIFQVAVENDQNNQWRWPYCQGHEIGPTDALNYSVPFLCFRVGSVLVSIDFNLVSTFNGFNIVQYHLTCMIWKKAWFFPRARLSPSRWGIWEEVMWIEAPLMKALIKISVVKKDRNVYLKMKILIKNPCHLPDNNQLSLGNCNAARSTCHAPARRHKLATIAGTIASSLSPVILLEDSLLDL